MRVSALVLLTLLLTPHLITYDLLLLAIPIVALADWAATHAADAGARRATALAVVLYGASFSPVIAEHARVQLSTLAIAASAWVACGLAARAEPARALSPECRAETARVAAICRNGKSIACPPLQGKGAG